LTYRDLIANFGKIVESVSRDDAKFPKTLVVNAFRGYLNEFVVQQRADDKENRAKGILLPNFPQKSLLIHSFIHSFICKI